MRLRDNGITRNSDLDSRRYLIFIYRCNLFSAVGPKEVIKMAIDQICKMEVDEKTANFKSEYKGKTYYFCAPGCKKAFDENPGKYINEEEN